MMKFPVPEFSVICRGESMKNSSKFYFSLGVSTARFKLFSVHSGLFGL